MAAADNHSIAYFLSRITWMAIGPVVLLILAFSIINNGSGWMTALDAAFFMVLLSVLAARWYEFQLGGAETATGDPATASDLHKYLLLMPLATIAVWILANLLGNHLLNG